MFNFIYSYYYLFYTKVIPDNEPHATTLYTLSFTEAAYWVVLLDVIYVNLFGEIIPLLGLGIILTSVIAKNYFYFFKIKDKKEIVKNANKSPLLLCITMLFFIIGMLLLFSLPFYLKTALG